MVKTEAVKGNYVPPDELPTLRQNEIPTPGRTAASTHGARCDFCKVGHYSFGRCVVCNCRFDNPAIEE
jgi:hypothetical protein